MMKLILANPNNHYWTSSVIFGVGFFDSYDVSKLMEMPRIEKHGTGSVHRIRVM